LQHIQRIKRNVVRLSRQQFAMLSLLRRDIF
jgi:hypothetical protein